MSELLELIANILCYWPSEANKKRREDKSLRNTSFRKVPDVMADEEEEKPGKNMRS